MSKEDLVAGKVDVAYVGLPSWFQPTGGTQWAANQMRLIRSYDHANTGHDMHLNINYFEHLNVVDYGNANQNPLLYARNMADQALVLRDILKAGAIPLVMGGDHGTQVAVRGPRAGRHTPCCACRAPDATMLAGSVVYLLFFT